MTKNYTTPSSDNVLLGAGTLYIDRWENGLKTGELHLGNVTEFKLTTVDTTKQLYESMTPTRGLYKEVTTQRTVTAAITGSEFNPENVALVMMGDNGTFTQTEGTITSQSLTANAKLGRYYPVGVRNISSVVVKSVTPGTTYVEGTDYVVDSQSGRVQILPTGSIVDGAALTVDCSYASVTLDTVEGANAGTIEASLRFIGDPTAGPAVEVEVFRAKINPTGDIGFIAEDFGAWQLNCSVLADGTHPAGESPYFRVLYL